MSFLRFIPSNEKQCSVYLCPSSRCPECFLRSDVLYEAPQFVAQMIDAINACLLRNSKQINSLNNNLCLSGTAAEGV